jgi:heme exporter protein B
VIPPSPTGIGLLHASWQVLRKELLVEWRQRARAVGLLFFALAILFMIAFAIQEMRVLSEVGGGLLWLGVLLASARSLDQSFAVELENGSLEGLVLWPVDPAAIFLGKAAANTLVLAVVATVITPAAIVLFNPTLRGEPAMLAALLAAGCAGLAAPGTLLAGITSQARGSSHLMPILYLPAVVPVLLCTSRATRAWFDGDAMGEADDWLLLVVLFNAVMWPLGAALFSRVVEQR